MKKKDPEYRLKEMKTFLQETSQGDGHGSMAFFGVWSKRSRYRPSVLEEDLNQLRAAYRDEGFLDRKIEQSGVSISPEGNSGLDLTIKPLRRPVLFRRDRLAKRVITTDELLADGRIKRGEPYSPTY